MIHLRDTDIQISYYHVLRQNSEFTLSLQRETDMVLRSRQRRVLKMHTYINKAILKV